MTRVRAITMLNVTVLLVALWCPAPAVANPQVDAAKEAYLRGEFRPALGKLAEAERSPTTTEDELVEILWYRGACYHALGKSKPAAAAFDQLLKLRPLFSPNPLETPPDLRAAFKERAEQWQQSHGISMGQPELKDATITVPIKGHAEDLGKVTVFARVSGETNYKPFQFPVESGVASGMVDDPVLWDRVKKAGRLELVIEANNKRGVVLARSGDARTPLVMEISDEQRAGALTALKKAGVVAPTSAPVAENGNGTSRDGGKATSGNPAPVKGRPPAKASPPSSPVPMALRGGAVGALALGALAGLGWIITASITALAGAAFGYGYYSLIQPGLDKDPAKRNQLIAVYETGGVGAVLLLPVGMIVGLASVAAFAAGVVLLVLGQMMA